ncbi:MAG: WbqC family protein [Blastochloris viridis]|uniref:WbqC family protein n=1 Tax=Blastochloris viridis TaxID=1079 RepID=A0A6N4RFG9_BLAVI|nr:MAG: WbqC family protein [Blastochloris viridis]
MQPYFFPYMGHFALIAAVDEWIVFDVTQYTPRTWMNRNRILHPTQEWQYVTVPLCNSSISIKTQDARVQDVAAAKQSTLGKLSHYRKAPFYWKVKSLVELAFDATQSDSLVALNVACLKEVCAYLEIPFRYRICSELELKYPEHMEAGDWAPFISQHVGATEYLNPLGGKELFDSKIFKEKGIELLFADFARFDYETPGYTFEPHLSILDVMMWNAPDVIREALHSHTTLVKV